MKRKPKIEKIVKDDSGPQLIGYARVSTEDQNLDLQRDALHKVNCLNNYEEKVSGAAKNRPELDRAIADLRPGDTLVVWRLDRLGRSIKQLLARFDEIVEAGASFRSLSENFELSTATGRLVLHIASAFAEFERQLTIERTRAGVAARQARGLPHGAPIKFTNEKRKLAKALLRRKDLDRKGHKKWTGKRVAKKLKLAANTIYLWINKGMPMLPEPK